MEDLDGLQELLNLTNSLKYSSLENSKQLLDIIKKDYSPKSETVVRKYDLNRISRFNIFETISDLYKREKFHSDILYTILDSETPEIGHIHNTGIIKEFVKMIDEKSDFIIDDTIVISKEEHNIVWDGTENKEGYIDLLIKNGHNQAIIVENKINEASDQPNQLVRYMSYVNEQLFSNGKPVKIYVVYLTLIPGKLPKIDEYDKHFSDYIEMIKDAKNGKDGKILKYRSAVDSNNEKGSLVKFLNNCLKYFNEQNNNESLLKKVYLEQYKILLSHIGGKAAMLEYQKDLIKSIYSSEENLKAAKDLIEVFSPDKNGENAIVNKYINDCLKPLVEPLGFAFEENWLYRYWDREHVNYIYVVGQFCKFQIGFGTSKKISKEKQKEYQNILEETFKMKAEIPDGSWVWLQIEPLAGKKNMEEFLKYYTSFIPKVKELFLKEKA